MQLGKSFTHCLKKALNTFLKSGFLYAASSAIPDQNVPGSYRQAERTNSKPAAKNEDEKLFPEIRDTSPSGLDIETEIYRHNLNDLIEKQRSRIEEELGLDELTQIPGRRPYNKRIELEIKRAKRNNHPLSLIMIDIDKFKPFNDTYGHEMGDIVLKTVAKILEKNVRNVDMVARYGGEEFVVILSDTDKEGAKAATEKLVKTVEKETQNQAHPPVTISAGYAEFNKDDPSLNNASRLRISADTALYNAKAAGRNQVIEYKDGMVIPSKKKAPEITPLTTEAGKKTETEPLQAMLKNLGETPGQQLQMIKKLKKAAERALREGRQKSA